MITRPLLKAGVLIAAIVVPYLALDEKLRITARNQWARWTGAWNSTWDSATQTKPADPVATATEPQIPAVTSPLTPVATSPVSAPPATVPLEEALRFDVTPEWVTARWPLFASVIDDSEHLGLRVMLVSGTTSTDVAGSLTYYFNQQRRLERITLYGVTGDPSRLGELAVSRFHLRPTETKELGLYYGGDVNVPTSSLKFSALSVVRAEAPLARVQVTLDLKRADVARVKSEAEQPAKVLPSSYRRW